MQDIGGKDKERTTHFGFQRVTWDEKTGKVAEVFHSVADKYDVMNDLMSMGVHRLWKRFAIEMSGVYHSQKVLDLASGTGDLAAKFAQRVGDSGRVVASDINASMLAQGRRRLLNHGLVANLDYVQANAEHLPFPDAEFDCVSIAFGLRNVTRIPQALSEMYRVLRPGGRLIILEFSKPIVPGIKPLYDAYSFNVLPWLGKLIVGDADSYRYLAESIRMHPDQETLKKMIIDAGFAECHYYNLSGGIVALHRAHKF